MDKTLTKYFWAFNLAVLAAVAYFSASGVGELVTTKVAALLPTPDQTASTKSPRANRSSTSRFRAPDGSRILERNIFDSTAGPIDDEFGDDFEETVIGTDGELPVVPCTDTGVTLQATVATEMDPAWSFATIAEGRENRLCRVGDTIGDRMVSGITWRYLFLKGSSDECYVDLFGDGEQPGKGPRKTTLSPRGGGNDEFKNGIEVVSDTERNVKRALVDKVMANPAQFARSVRVRPHKQNGEVVGFKLRRIKSDSPLGMLGAQKGDIIHSVNGVELTSVDKALTAYQTLRSSSQLNFSITRKGKPVDMKINIK